LSSLGEEEKQREGYQHWYPHLPSCDLLHAVVAPKVVYSIHQADIEAH